MGGVGLDLDRRSFLVRHLLSLTCLQLSPAA
jgi:hypothetical protein